MKKTKIVCTIGPQTCTKEGLEKLIEAGMNIARLNGSHNTLEWHINAISLIREVDPTITILVDLPGRKIRTAHFEHQFTFEKYEEIVFTTDPGYDGTEKVLVNYPHLHKDLSIGDIVLADDGTLKFELLEINDREITFKTLTKGILKTCKGLNVPYVKVNTPLIQDKDIRIIEMCKEQDVDLVGVSFVESGDHLKEIYDQLKGSNVEVIAKVENQFGMDNLESILNNCFGILIDRGDLGAETSIFNISIHQKQVLKQARKLGKPVIVATEMLHTMIENPFPTKAEVNDISNAVLDGASALMMSGETAVGAFPYDACQTMNNIILEAEKYQDKLNHKLKISVKDTPNSVAKGIKEVCEALDITKVVCITKSGYAAQMLSRYRLKQELIVVTNSIEQARKFNLYWGATPVVHNFQFRPESSDHDLHAVLKLLEDSILDPSDTIVLTGVRYPNPKSNTRMNYMAIHNIADLQEVFQ
jgi:pyruvate kinase